MTHEPFLRVPVRSWRGLIHVRHRARQIAQLLRFGHDEVIATAAGAFAVADQALAALGPAHLCFAVADGQLHAFANPKRRRIPAPAGLLVLRKALPADELRLAAEDVAWLIRQVQLLAPTTLEVEVRRQNQETLELLSALESSRKNSRPGENPTAA